MIGKPTVWGEDDCILAAADACLLVTGVDPVARVRGRWSSKAEAYRVILEFGDDLAAAMQNYFCNELGYRPSDPADAPVGSMGAIELDGVFTSACRIGEGWFLRKERGFVILPTVALAWSPR